MAYQAVEGIQQKPFFEISLKELQFIFSTVVFLLHVTSQSIKHHWSIHQMSCSVTWFVVAEGFSSSDPWTQVVWLKLYWRLINLSTCMYVAWFDQWSEVKILLPKCDIFLFFQLCTEASCHVSCKRTSYHLCIAGDDRVCLGNRATKVW